MRQIILILFLLAFSSCGPSKEQVVQDVNLCIRACNYDYGYENYDADDASCTCRNGQVYSFQELGRFQ